MSEHFNFFKYTERAHFMEINQRFMDAVLDAQVNITLRIAEQKDYRLPSVLPRMYAGQEETQDIRREVSGDLQVYRKTGEDK